MTIDSTLLGALIGAGAAIVGGMLTAAWTNHSSKKREEFMLRNEKREQLYISYHDMRNATYNFIGLFSGRKFSLSDIEKIDESFNLSNAKIHMLTKIYFNELYQPHLDTIKSFNIFFNNNISPLCQSFEDENDAVELAKNTSNEAFKAYKKATSDIDIMIEKIEKMRI